MNKKDTKQEEVNRVNENKNDEKINQNQIKKKKTGMTYRTKEKKAKKIVETIEKNIAFKIREEETKAETQKNV